MASELQDALVRHRYLGRLLSRAGELQRVKLGLLEPADLRAAVARSAAEGWNQTATDWSRLIELEPAGCFAARRGKHLVGTVTTITYGRALAWIGMMVYGFIVNREYLRWRAGQFESRAWYNQPASVAPSTRFVASRRNSRPGAITVVMPSSL